MQRVFPNLFVIGAMKAGTSSLHEYLHQHPQIFMSRFKEPQYFAPHATRWGQMWGQGNPCPEPGSAWYERLFADAGDVRYAGESSVSYTARPWVENCEQRIYAFNPAARLVYLMRDPVERVISHYWHFVNDGREDLDLISAIRRKPDYLARSHYAMQLRPYVDRFGADQVFTMTLEEFNSDPARWFSQLFQWLNIDVDVPIDTSQRFNVSDAKITQTRRGRVFLDTLIKHGRWKRLEARLPASVPSLIRRLTYRQVARSDVETAAAIELIRPSLQAQTRELSELLGREFPEWTTLYPSTQSAAPQCAAVGITNQS